jgi:hypothetical protein
MSWLRDVINSDIVLQRLLDFLTIPVYDFGMKEAQIIEPEDAAVTAAPVPALKAATDPIQLLREVLELQSEGNPDLNVEDTMAYAIANPDGEVVDSLGAVSVVCAFFGTYTPTNLIPQELLTHRNFSTLNGLRAVLIELEKRQAGQ